MGGLCVFLLMLFCAIWILCMLFLSILIPLVVIYNGIVGIVCLVVYFILKKKQFFTKYTEGYKYVLSRIIKIWAPHFWHCFHNICHHSSNFTFLLRNNLFHEHLLLK